MRLAMDRLYEAVTQLDIEIHKQLRQPCTVGALRELERLEAARELAHKAQMILVRLETVHEHGTPLDAAPDSSSTEG